MTATIKLKLTIAFDGTHYAGWQTQTTGVAVQECIEKALSKVFPGEHRLVSSSRTDSGVHARAMIAHLELPRALFKMEPRKLALALNAHLAEDIRIVLVQRVPSSFHARFDALGKEYRYSVWNHTAMDPLRRGQAWHVPHEVDIELMRKAAALLIGKHDFRSFAATHTYHIKDTVRTLFRVDIRKQGCLLTFIIEGDGFLYKMCRGIVGTLIQVGRGRFAPSEVQAMLEARDRRTAGMSAPACGLVLWQVHYPKTKLKSQSSDSHRSSPISTDSSL